MTDAQLALLARLTKDELLIAIRTLLPFAADRDVVRGALDALDHRTSRLRGVWEAARADANRAYEAWKARSSSQRLRAEYHTASAAADRAFDATERAHAEWTRALAFGRTETEEDPK
jgi:hypothetical protein